VSALTVHAVDQVRELRGRPDGSRDSVSDETWQLLHYLRATSVHDRHGTLEQLAELFAAGDASAGIDGPTEGMLVTSTVQPQVDTALHLATEVITPWLGKRFHADGDGGEDLLARWARLPSKLVWPLYSMSDDPQDEAVAAFAFETRVEPGALGTSQGDVLVVDYGPLRDNPWSIRVVRDELVHLAGDVHLGRMLVRQLRGHALAAYFALRARTSPRGHAAGGPAGPGQASENS
jgi:hypothetical protein